MWSDPAIVTGICNCWFDRMYDFVKLHEWVEDLENWENFEELVLGDFYKRLVKVSALSEILEIIETIHNWLF